MRHIGFFRHWVDYNTERDLFDEDEFTTLRAPRKQPLEVGESLIIMFKPMSMDSKLLGLAEVIKLEPRALSAQCAADSKVSQLTTLEVRGLGFPDSAELWHFITKLLGKATMEPMELITLRWIKREVE